MNLVEVERVYAEISRARVEHRIPELGGFDSVTVRWVLDHPVTRHTKPVPPDPIAYIMKGKNSD